MYRTRGGRFDASVFLVVSVDVGVLYLYSVFTLRIEKCFTLSPSEAGRCPCSTRRSVLFSAGIAGRKLEKGLGS